MALNIAHDISKLKSICYQSSLINRRDCRIIDEINLKDYTEPWIA